MIEAAGAVGTAATTRATRAIKPTSKPALGQGVTAIVTGTVALRRTGLTDSCSDRRRRAAVGDCRVRIRWSNALRRLLPSYDKKAPHVGLLRWSACLRPGLQPAPPHA